MGRRDLTTANFSPLQATPNLRWIIYAFIWNIYVLVHNTCNCQFDLSLLCGKSVTPEVTFVWEIIHFSCCALTTRGTVVGAQQCCTTVVLHTAAYKLGLEWWHWLSLNFKPMIKAKQVSPLPLLKPSECLLFSWSSLSVSSEAQQVLSPPVKLSVVDRTQTTLDNHY